MKCIFSLSKNTHNTANYAFLIAKNQFEKLEKIFYEIEWLKSINFIFKKFQKNEKLKIYLNWRWNKERSKNILYYLSWEPSTDNNHHPLSPTDKEREGSLHSLTQKNGSVSFVLMANPSLPNEEPLPHILFFIPLHLQFRFSQFLQKPLTPFLLKRYLFTHSIRKGERFDFGCVLNHGSVSGMVFR